MMLTIKMHLNRSTEVYVLRIFRSSCGGGRWSGYWSCIWFASVVFDVEVCMCVVQDLLVFQLTKFVEFVDLCFWSSQWWNFVVVVGVFAEEVSVIGSEVVLSVALMCGGGEVCMVLIRYLLVVFTSISPPKTLISNSRVCDSQISSKLVW